MGGCVGTSRRRRRDDSSRRPSFSFSTSSNPDRCSSLLSKNRPLRHEKIRWRSDIPLTEGQLKSKRDEFWDTAPAFEGKQEIWNALKGSVEATENGPDYDLAQAILDGAGISLPNGSLVECYDVLGTRYAIPVYCLSLPINIVSNGKNEEGGWRGTLGDESEPVLNEEELGPEIKLKVRISLKDSADEKLLVRGGETVLSAKKKLCNLVEGMVEPSSQRWYFGGKVLSDQVRISDACIPSGHVVQCISNESVKFGVIHTSNHVPG